jgi:hypothetical protein
MKNMANCPNCGSSHINLKKETNVSWGRAVAGWALFGVVGGAVGAITGEDRNVNACLDCGTSWKATDLYKTLQIIKNATGVTLDLAKEPDRLYMNSFMAELGSYLKSISNVEKQAEQLITSSQSKLNEKAATGCGFGCLTSIAGCTIVASSISSGGLLWVLVIPPLIGWGVGTLMDAVNKRSIERDIEKAKRKAKTLKPEAEERFKLKVKEFMASHSL